MLDTQRLPPTKVENCEKNCCIPEMGIVESKSSGDDMADHEARLMHFVSSQMILNDESNSIIDRSIV